MKTSAQMSIPLKTNELRISDKTFSDMRHSPTGAHARNNDISVRANLPPNSNQASIKGQNQLIEVDLPYNWNKAKVGNKISRYEAR